MQTFILFNSLFLWAPPPPFDFVPTHLCTNMLSHTYTANVLLHWGFMSLSAPQPLPLSFHTQEWVQSEGEASLVDIPHYTFEMLINKPSLEEPKYRHCILIFELI